MSLKTAEKQELKHSNSYFLWFFFYFLSFISIFTLYIFSIVTISFLLPQKCDICYIYEAVLSHRYAVNSIASVLSLRPINSSILS